MKMVFVCQNIIRLCTHRPKDLTLGRLRDLCYVEPFQPDLTVSQLQSNRTKTIRISGDILAAIGERDQGRLFRSLGNLVHLAHIRVYRGAESPWLFTRGY
jgi:hypothetical protein